MSNDELKDTKKNLSVVTARIFRSQNKHKSEKHSVPQDHGYIEKLLRAQSLQYKMREA